MTRRAKHWQNGIIERGLVQPARSNLQRAASFSKDALTRRAKHRHDDIIETSLVHPRGRHPPRVFSSRFQNRTAAAHCGHALVKPGAPIGAPAVRTIAGRARANVPARAAAVSGRHGDRVRARNDRASPGAICRAFSSHGGMMTVYLISLALAGLVAIVLWEMLS
ncbi:hypothetical protein [Bradyrhizobium tunisiense]|uniref:hypothetical protein n=1 Tax=Bradyrhizobium tunisiense TaxID=3278709 RepID=UPI0035D72BC7